MKKKQQKQKLQTPTKPNSKHDTTELTFLEHIYELRSRLFWIVTTIIVASAAGFQFKDQLIAVVMDPLHGQKLVYLTPGGGFGFIFTLAIYFGVLIAIPVIVYHVYRFLQPLLQEASRRLIITFMFLSCLLAAGGAAFGYFVTIPAALDFLATFAGDAVIPNLTAESYLNFVVAYILGLAVLFQLPLLLFLFDHVKQFPPGSLLSSQRYVIIGATVVSAVITPTPDAFNMAIVAIPIIAIYQLGVIAVSLRHKVLARKGRNRAKQHEQAQVVQVAEPMTVVLKQIGKRGVASYAKDMAVPIAPSHPHHQTASENTVVTKVRMVRTIDGVMRQAPQPIVVPMRADVAKVSAVSRAQARQVRSLDGLSMMRSATQS